jgi:hypothetical protein
VLGDGGDAGVRRASVTVPTSARPLAVTIALDAAGA